jgi:hypothetical protein
MCLTKLGLPGKTKVALKITDALVVYCPPAEM